jgi:hypothetical protein
MTWNRWPDGSERDDPDQLRREDEESEREMSHEQQ